MAATGAGVLPVFSVDVEEGKVPVEKETRVGEQTEVGLIDDPSRGMNERLAGWIRAGV